MFSSTTYVIRGARISDARDLERIAALDSQRPVNGHILVGEIDGRAEAAMSLDDGRLVANPFVHTESLAAHLRIRARGIHAAEDFPAVRERIRRGVRVRHLERS
ncbi:MAG: hypothetical protein QOK21_1933 [Solirubrobacteraceae bacterium]|jgi:riboflavin synthase alpha subunit|nr:hypothetical protein [Solirubrobacteraceae bacterium]